MLVLPVVFLKKSFFFFVERKKKCTFAHEFLKTDRKMKQQIVRIMMAMMVLASYSVSANAQLNGLLNKAKRAAENKANQVINQQAQKLGETVTSAINGNMVNLYYDSGNPMGEWYPETRVFKQMGKDGNTYRVSHVYTFNSDGSVVEDGQNVGEILPDGTMNTPQTKGIKYDPETGQVTRNGEWFGKITDDGMYIFNDRMARAAQPMDKQVQAFILFNLIATNEMLTDFKKKYDEIVKRGDENRQMQIANIKANQAAEAGAVKLWKGGSVCGEIRSNDEVWIGGSNRGKFDSNGNIWVGGSVAGKIEGNNIRKGGSVVGKVENGNVWVGGSVAGQIRANGDVVQGGSVVGRAPGFKDARKVAVIYFFGFYAL